MRFSARMGGIWALLHPGPSLLTVLAFVICATIAAHGHPALATLALATIGLTSQQFAISALNDYCDRSSDALQVKQRKPIVLGLVSPGFALSLALLLAAIMVVCFLPLGIIPLGFAAWFLLLGFAYDLGIKSTPISGLMHGLAFPTIPLLAWALFAHLCPQLLWAFPLGMCVGIGIHLADAIPDADSDSQAGIHGLAQALGKSAQYACWGAMALAIALIAGIALAAPTRAATHILLSTALVGCGLLISTIVLFWRSRGSIAARYRQQFVLLVATSLVVVAGWFTAIIL